MRYPERLKIPFVITGKIILAKVVGYIEIAVLIIIFTYSRKNKLRIVYSIPAEVIEVFCLTTVLLQPFKIVWSPVELVRHVVFVCPVPM